jgi:lipopolysaccharide/colanic/teichoic acid biosynthesis glycosyltransferase
VEHTKRGIDVVLSLFLLVVLSPILLAAALVIKLDSRGTVLFRQVRIGRNFRPFSILKFRTMRSQLEGSAITARGDRRVTRVGRWLRASKIDELPQLVNVLRGDMSIVGPRPEIPEFVDLFRDRYQRILQVRPGITDPASIAFRNEEEILGSSSDPLRTYREEILPAKLELSEKYLRERTLRADIAALARTAAALFSHSRPT